MVIWRVKHILRFHMKAHSPITNTKYYHNDKSYTTSDREPHVSVCKRNRLNAYPYCQISLLLSQPPKSASTNWNHLESLRSITQQTSPMAIGRLYYYTTAFLCCMLYATSHYEPYPERGFGLFDGVGNRFRKRRENEEEEAKKEAKRARKAARKAAREVVEDAEEIVSEWDDSARAFEAKGSKTAGLNARRPRDGHRRERSRARVPRRWEPSSDRVRGASDKYFTSHGRQEEEIRPIRRWR